MGFRLERTRRTWVCSSLAYPTLVLCVVGALSPLRADDGMPDPATAAALGGEITHMQRVQTLFPDADNGSQPTPPVIPELEIDLDPSGAIATFQPNGPTITADNAFFQNLGSKGRICLTCHQQEDG
jgi:hypothetical protein